MRSWVLLIALALSLPAMAQEKTPIVTAQLLLHAPQVKAGAPITAGVLFTLPPQWHIYWRNPGDSGMATSLEWSLPPGIEASTIQWPAPERIETSGLVNYGYSSKVILPVGLTAQQDGIAGDVAVKASWLVCKDICIPESATLHGALPADSPQAEQLLANATQALPKTGNAAARYTIVGEQVKLSIPYRDLVQDGEISAAQWIPVEDGIIANDGEQHFVMERDTATLSISAPRGSAATLPAEWHGLLRLQTGPEEQPLDFLLTARTEEQSTASSSAPTASNLPLVAALLFAFLGGLILNAMPCVLPILSLKALALAKKSGAQQRAARAQGIAYSAGVIASFLLIAALMLSLRAGGAAIGWGFQLQEPVVVAGLFFLMLLVALNLFGLLELPVLFGNTTSDTHSLRGAFLTGALAVALATPCTAPFMAPALGATLTLPATSALLIFAALGLGMAFPFLLVSLIPATRGLLPKPGAWMVRFKQFLAFPMLATAAWLLWVLNHATEGMGLVLALTGAVLIAWLVWWAHGTHDRTLRKLLLLCAAGVIAWASFMQPDPGGVSLDTGMIPYNAVKLDELRAQGVPVLVDATADWCLTCKINERFALHDDGVKMLFGERNIVLMVADWTRRDADITAYLAGFGRGGVPLYVYYPPHGEPLVLPQLLTPGIVRDAIEHH